MTKVGIVGIGVAALFAFLTLVQGPTPSVLSESENAEVTGAIVCGQWCNTTGACNSQNTFGASCFGSLAYCSGQCWYCTTGGAQRLCVDGTTTDRCINLGMFPCGGKIIYNCEYKGPWNCVCPPSPGGPATGACTNEDC
jgi:hypothetical protein